jgi:hypothetical protein
MGFFEELGSKFFNNLTNKLHKDTAQLYNNSFVAQDVNTAKEIVKVYIDKNFKNSSSNPYKFYLEAIFLGKSDRTCAHPYLVKTIPSSKSSSFIETQMGFQNNEIDYNEDPDFNSIDYFNTNWFHPILDSYLEKKQELEKSKQLYKSGDISFFDYFVKRLEVYDFIQEKEHMKHYEGVDRKKYIDILRSEFRLILR